MRKVLWVTVLTGMVGMATFAKGAEEKPFDVIANAYAPYVDAKESLGLGMKVRSLAESPYKFWRGSKDLFVGWSRESCKDWWADEGMWIVQQGDLHVGNVGTYAVDGRGTLAFGLVDFDDSGKGPVGLEVVQGLVTLRVLAADRKIEVSGAEWERIENEFCGSYAGAFAGGKNATEILRADAWVAKLFEDEGKNYEKVLKKFTEGGKFRRVVGGEKPKDLLTARAEGKKGIAAALAGMFAREAGTRGMLKVHSAEVIEGHIVDVAERVRVASSGSQGQKKIFVLMDAEATADGTSQVIVYLKETIPSALVRSGMVKEERKASERLVEDTRELTNPRAGWVGGGWTELDGRTYWVSLHEGWSAELDPADVKDAADLLHAAKILGVAAGASHQGEAAGRVKAKLGAELMKQAKERAVDFVAKVQRDYANFSADPRTEAMKEAAGNRVRELVEAGRAGGGK